MLSGKLARCRRTDIRQPNVDPPWGWPWGDAGPKLVSSQFLSQGSPLPGRSSLGRYVDSDAQEFTQFGDVVDVHDDFASQHCSHTLISEMVCVGEAPDCPGA